jgi:hypothetical protein
VLLQYTVFREMKNENVQRVTVWRPRRLRSVPGHIGFLVNEVALCGIFLGVLQLPLPILVL